MVDPFRPTAGSVWVVADGLKTGLQASEYPDEELRQYFSQFGNVLTFQRGVNANGSASTHAYIEFATGEAAERAISASPHLLGEWRINLCLRRTGVVK